MASRLIPGLVAVALALSAQPGHAQKTTDLDNPFAGKTKSQPTVQPPRIKRSRCPRGNELAVLEQPLDLQGGTTLTLFESGVWCDKRTSLTGKLDIKSMRGLRLGLKRLVVRPRTEPCGLGAYPRPILRDIAGVRTIEINSDACTKVHASVTRWVKRLRYRTIDACQRGPVIFQEEAWPVRPPIMRRAVLRVHRKGLAERLVDTTISRACLNRDQVAKLSWLIRRVPRSRARNATNSCQGHPITRSVIKLGRWTFEWSHPCGDTRPRLSLERVRTWVHEATGLQVEKTRAGADLPFPR